MDEALARRVEDEVLRRLDAAASALLVGDPPGDALGYRLTAAPPCDAVLIGSLEPGELLNFSDSRVLDALLEGKPVFLWEPGLRHRARAATANRALWARLQSAERSLKQLGVRFYGPGGGRKLVTAEQARLLLRQGRRPPEGAVLTPLAREVLNGGGI